MGHFEGPRMGSDPTLPHHQEGGNAKLSPVRSGKISLWGIRNLEFSAPPAVQGKAGTSMQGTNPEQEENKSRKRELSLPCASLQTPPIQELGFPKEILRNPEANNSAIFSFWFFFFLKEMEEMTKRLSPSCRAVWEFPWYKQVLRTPTT